MQEKYKKLVEYYIDLGYSIEDAEHLANLEYLSLK